MYRAVLIAIICSSLCSCYFFRKRGHKNESGTTTSNISNMGSKASGSNLQALSDLYAITTDQPPAPVRPDPDVVVRRLLLQYRTQGSTVAREIGRVESYRLLLGGASEDFSTAPQETYDATSLLANIKVAQEICQGLVAPTAALQPGWSSILPFDPTQSSENIKFLAQRFLGIPTNDIPAATLSRLNTILQSESGGSAPTRDHYIPVCTALFVDAQSLLL